jgi:hypothetical protein
MMAGFNGGMIRYCIIEFYTLVALLSCLQPFEISSFNGTSIVISTAEFAVLMMRFKYSSIDSSNNDRSSYDMVVIVLKMTVLTIGVNLME